MAQIPATVTIPQLPAATTLTLAEVIEAVQTTGGVANSVQIPLSSIATTLFGTLPTGGGTGQILEKTGGTNFVSNWVNLGSLVTSSTGIGISGSTALAVSLASTTGLSVLGVTGTATAAPGAIVGTADQVLVVNHAGTAVNFGPVNLATSAAVTGVLPIANGGTNTSTLGTGIVLGNVTGALSVLAATTAGLFVQSNGSGSPPQWVGGMALVNTLSPANVATAGDTTSLTSTYRNYMITFENIVPANNNVTFQLQVATSGTTFISGSYISQASLVVGQASANAVSSTVILLTGTTATTALGNSTTYGFNGFVKVFNPASSNFRKMFVGEGVFLNGTTSTTTAFGYNLVQGYYDGASSPVTGVQFSMSSGNIATGTIKIYGMT